MWEINNYNQAITFIMSLCLGGLFCALYDIIRAVRKVCFNSFFAVTIVDILIWLVYAFTTFIFLISRTNGEIRGYVILGELLGFILCRISFSRLLFPLFSFIFVKIDLVKRRTCKVLDVFYQKFELLVAKMLKIVMKFFKTAKKLLKYLRSLLYTDKNIASLEKSFDETKTEA